MVGVVVRVLMRVVVAKALKGGSQMGRVSMWGLGLLVMVVSVGAGLGATPVNPAPEIDGSSLSAGLGLLTASVLIVRSRSRK